jgi:hypothetical protein
MTDSTVNQSRQDDGMTFLFSPEIEEATVSIIWKHPERVAAFLRDFDPTVHLVQLHLRIIVEAINIAYGELGAADFPIVLQVVRELGQLGECGGIPGLNKVYEASYYTSPIFEEYLRLLREYAEHRQTDPLTPLHFFTNGKGTLYKNKNKTRPNDPDYIGPAKVRGRSYRLRAWLCEDLGQVLNIMLDPK